MEEIKLFDLENRYQFLKRNAQEIIVKSKAYDQLYQEQLKRQFGIGTDELSEYIFRYTEDHLNRVLSKFNEFKEKETETLFEDELYRLLYGGYADPDEFGKRPLSKFIKDIYSDTIKNIGGFDVLKIE